MKTHPAITHPALRHRMAVALNQLRHSWTSRATFFEASELISNRDALRDGIERMAALEQALDDAQESRIFGTIPS